MRAEREMFSRCLNSTLSFPINTGLQAGERYATSTLAVSTAYPNGVSLHSYSRCWLHLIWGTLNREKMLHKEAAARVSHYLKEYAEQKNLYMKINHVNADHVHALIDLPTHLSIEEALQLFRQFVALGECKQS
jgi:hypothetical protein